MCQIVEKTWMWILDQIFYDKWNYNELEFHTERLIELICFYMF